MLEHSITFFFSIIEYVFDMLIEQSSLFKGSCLKECQGMSPLKERPTSNLSISSLHIYQLFLLLHTHLRYVLWRPKHWMRINMQRIVNRSDLKSEDSASSNSPEPDATDRLKQLNQFELRHQHLSIEKNNNGNNPTAEEDELDFQLFAPSKAKETPHQSKSVHKIKLRSPSVDYDQAGFIQPKRNQAYYFAKALSTKEKENIEAAATSGHQVLAQSQSLRPGSAYSWKVLHLPASGLSKSIRTQEANTFRKLVDDSGPRERTRPGKKYRIKLRTKRAALREKQEAAKVAEEAKEAAEREKRTRRNREKKVKKKVREKAKKAESRGDDQNGVEVANGGHDVTMEESAG